VDRIRVEKGKRTLTLYRGKTVVRQFRVALGSNPRGAKSREGDGRTPEGHYVVDFRNEQSQFHLALHISYPNADDRARAASEGVDPGGDIMIHGWGRKLGQHRLRDWTDGCIAVTNAEMGVIWRLVPDGTPIEIVP
jgi:murein L,D-transpeptidase YafK